MVGNFVIGIVVGLIATCVVVFVAYVLSELSILKSRQTYDEIDMKYLAKDIERLQKRDKDGTN